jgi:hypothetical protein
MENFVDKENPEKKRVFFLCTYLTQLHLSRFNTRLPFEGVMEQLPPLGSPTVLMVNSW